jgi:hypothetical protein
MIITKEKLDKLLEKKSALELDLTRVDREIESITRSVERTGSKPTAVKKVPPTNQERVRKGKKSSQPSIESLVVEILKEKKRTLAVNEIAVSLLNEKKYMTSSANFKNQLRVILYRNQKGLFKNVGPGEFALAGEKVSAGEKAEPKTKPPSPLKTPVIKKSGTKKEAVQKKKSAPTKPVVKRTVAKPKSPKKGSPTKKIAQPSIESLIVDVLKEKKKPMTVYEIAGALLNEKKYQTTSKNFDDQIRILLSKNTKGAFKKLKAGQFGLA